MGNLFTDVYGWYDRNVRQRTGEIVNPLLDKAVKAIMNVDDAYVKSGAADTVRYAMPWAPDPKKGYFGSGKKSDPLTERRKVLGLKPDEPVPDMESDNIPTYEDGKYKYDSPTKRNVDRKGAKGTQTSPSPVKFDGTDGMDAFIKKLQAAPYGITFGGQGGRTPMESTNLPDTSTGKMVSITNGANAGKYVAVNDPNFDAIVRGTKEGGVAGEQTSGGGKGSGLTAALADTDGMRSYMKRVSEAEAPKGDDGYGPGYATDGLDARSRAFLDYDGKGGSMMALRAADAAQKTVYAGGKLYDVSGKNDKGKYNVVNDKGREFLRQNRNATTDAQAYKEAYQKGIAVPEDAASEDSKQPVMSSRADYMQQSQRDLDGTLVMGPDDKIEPFENNVNRSYITGSPGQDVYNTTKNPFVDRQEPPTTGFLPDQEVEEEIKKLYLR